MHSAYLWLNLTLIPVHTSKNGGMHRYAQVCTAKTKVFHNLIFKKERSIIIKWSKRFYILLKEIPTGTGP